MAKKHIHATQHDFEVATYLCVVFLLGSFMQHKIYYSREEP